METCEKCVWDIKLLQMLLYSDTIFRQVLGVRMFKLWFWDYFSMQICSFFRWLLTFIIYLHHDPHSDEHVAEKTKMSLAEQSVIEMNKAVVQAFIECLLW